MLTPECRPHLVPLELGSLLTIGTCLVDDDAGHRGFLLFFIEPSDFAGRTEDKPDEDPTRDGQAAEE